MSPRSYAKLALPLAAAGMLFSGYLSWTRASSGVCAFDESCPLFLGQPACYTGFALFAALFAVSLFALLLRGESRWPIAVNAAVSLVGVLFAGGLSLGELSAHTHYQMGLPTCGWGFIFFLAMLVTSVYAWMGRAQRRRLA